MDNPAYTKLTPEQEAERDTIIFGKYDPNAYGGGCRSFRKLDPRKMSKLIKLGYAHPDATQGSCPDIEACLKFCRSHKGFRMHGYVVSRERNDCRVSVEGVEANGSDVVDRGAAYVDTIIDFVDLFRFADDLQIGGENSAWYCWFD